MSSVHIIPSSENLVETVLGVLRGQSRELDGALVVFPGKRPSHFVRKGLATLKQSGFIPPKILAYDEFVDFLTERMGLRKPIVDSLDGASILYDIHRKSTEPIGGEYFTSFEEFLPLGFKLFDELEELFLADVPERRLNETVGGITFGRRHVLLEYFKGLYQSIEQKGFSTSSTKLTSVADAASRIDVSEYHTVIMAGFYSLTPVDRRIFNALLKLEQSVFLFQQGPGLVRQLKALGIESTGSDKDPGGSQIELFSPAGSGESGPPARGKTSASVSGRGPSLHLYKSADTHGQVFALNGIIQPLIESEKSLDETNVVMLPSSETLFPVLHQTLSLLPENGYNISLGYPLSRTPLYGFLSSLLDLAATYQDGSLEAGAYLRFVLHPYVKNIRYGTRSDITRVLFHTIEETIARRPSTTVSLEELESDNAIPERVANSFSEEQQALSKTRLKAHLKELHDHTIRPFLAVENIGDFSGKTIALVQYINDHSTAHLHPLFHRAAEELVKVADEVRRSLAAERKFSNAGAYAIFLRNYIAPQTVPFPGTPLGGLQVLGLLETRNLSFRRVFILDASDDILPGGSGAEMLIPQGVREQLGLETSRDRERLTEYYLHLLMSGADEVHLFFAENSSREKSRFIEKLIWDQQKSLGDPAFDGNVRQARYAIHLANSEPPPVMKSEAITGFLREFDLTATALDQYLACPLRFYYRFVLRLREKEEVEEEIEQYDIGNIVHGILNVYFGAFVGKTLTREDLDSARMAAVSEAEFEKAFGKNLKGAALLLKQQTIGRLQEFLKDYQRIIIEEQEVEIVGVEQEIEVMKGEHLFRGRVDRIERRGGKTFILDYKIRQDDALVKLKWKRFEPDNRETWSDAIGSLQLPMYMLLYSEREGIKPEEIQPAYLFLGRNQLSKQIEATLSKDGIITEDVYRNLEKVIFSLADEIKDPKIPFTPTEDQKKQCPRCPYQVMCGTQWAREGRW